MLFVFANYAILALTFVLGKQVVQLAHPLLVIGVRMVLAGSLLIAFIAWRNWRELALSWVDVPRILKVAFFHIYLAFTCEFWALQYLPSSRVNLIYSSTPFIAAGLSYYLKNERLTKIQVLALILGILGIAPNLLTDQNASLFSTSKLFIANFALVISVVSAAFAWFDIEKLMLRYSILWINALAMFIGGLGALATAVLTLGRDELRISHPAEFTGEVLLLIILSNFLFYNLFGWLLKRYSLTLLTFAGLLSPMFGGIYGALLLGEKIDWKFGLSLSILGIALALYCKEERKSQLNL